MEEFELNFEGKKVKLGILRNFSERVNFLEAYGLVEKFNSDSKNKKSGQKIRIISPKLADHILIKTDIWKKFLEEESEYNYSDFFIDEFIIYGVKNEQLGTKIEMEYELNLETIEKSAKTKVEKSAAASIKAVASLMPRSINFMPTKKILFRVPKKLQAMKNIALVVESVDPSDLLVKDGSIELMVAESRINVMKKFPTKVGAFSYDKELVIPFGNPKIDEKNFEKEDLRVIQYLDDNPTIVSKVFVGPITRASSKLAKTRKYIGAFYSPESKAGVVVEFI